MLSKLLLEPLMDFFRRRFILIADDNLDLAISLSMLLKLVGFEVETVHNGRDAVTAAKHRRPDVLLLDIGLPGLDGYQVARQIPQRRPVEDRIHHRHLRLLPGHVLETLHAGGFRPLFHQARRFQDPAAADPPGVLAPSVVRITDAGLAHISGLKDLGLLSLDKTGVGDAGLVHLAGLTKLGLLSLHRTRITDAGLVHLEKLTSLRNLNIGRTAVTREAAQGLRKALPGLVHLN